MKKGMIRKAIKEANESQRLPNSVRFVLLKDCQYMIPTLADWVYQEWHDYDASLTQEKLLESFKNRLNEDKIPFTVVACKNDKPVGLISLKEDSELGKFQDSSPWLGSLIVKEKSIKGLDEELLTLTKAIAGRLGHQKILFYLSNPHAVEWYVKRGAQVMEHRPFRGHTVTLLSLPIS